MCNSYAHIVYLPDRSIQFSNEEIDDTWNKEIYSEGISNYRPGIYLHEVVNFLFEQLKKTGRIAKWDDDQLKQIFEYIKGINEDEYLDEWDHYSEAFDVLVYILAPFTLIKIGNNVNSNNDEINLINNHLLDKIIICQKKTL